MDPFRPLLRALSPLFDHPRWPRVRALLIALHLVAVTAVACPAPVRSMPAASWKRAAVQEELQGWSQRLATIGITKSPADIQAWSIDVQTQWMNVRRELVWPFQKYLHLVGAAQGWYMFTGPDREPQRFVLAFTSVNDTVDSTVDSTVVAAGGSKPEEVVFELGYELKHPELVLPDFLDDHRIRRSLFQASWSKSDNTFRLVCDAFNKRLRVKRANVDDVVCRLVSRPVEHPYKRGKTRTDSVVRELTLHRDGTSRESRDGVVSVPKQPRGKAADKTTKTTKAAP